MRVSEEIVVYKMYIFFLGEVYSGGGGVPRERVLKQSFEKKLLLFF